MNHVTDVELPQDLISPIIGVFEAPNEPFAAVIDRLIAHGSNIAASAFFFAQRAKNDFQLTQDEIAAINLYTLESDFYRVLNQTLRDRDRKKLKPFFPYLKPLLLGLTKLPSYQGKVWRGVKLDLRKEYPKGKEFFWWSFSSCTVDVNVLEKEEFCGKSGHRTIFCISSERGKDVKEFSCYREEGEILLMPGYFVVRGVMEPAAGCTIIDIQELPPPFDIFCGIPKGVVPTPTHEIGSATHITLPAQKPNELNKIHCKFNFGSVGTGDGQFQNPWSVAVDEHIIVADHYNHRIQVFGKNGNFICKFGSNGNGNGQFCLPMGVAVNNGNIIVADFGNHRIQIFGKDGRFIKKFGSQGSGDGQLNYPVGVAVDRDHIFVADTNNCRIQIFSLKGEFLWKFGTQGAGAGQLYNPTGVAVDDNHIVVADYSNNRIQIFGKDGKFIKKKGGDSPYGVSMDKDWIVIVEYFANRIKVLGRDGKNIQTFGSKDDFAGPRGVAIDDNHIVVMDTGNHRIQVLGWS